MGTEAFGKETGPIKLTIKYAADGNPRRTPLIGKRAIYGWKIAGGGKTTAHVDPGIT
jgi:hypothetical protein